VFDDTFEHEVWNQSDKTRYVLLFDVWHPDLTDIEVELLEQLREHAGIHDGRHTVEQIRADRIRYQHNCGSPALSGSSSNNPIDWLRLAEPQADQYDTDVILQLASTTTSAGRPQPYRRTPVGAPAAFDGHVAI